MELPKNLEFIKFFSNNFFSLFTFEIKNSKRSDRMTKLRFSFSSDDCAITVYVQGILVLLEMWLPKWICKFRCSRVISIIQWKGFHFSSVQFSSVAQPCPTLCNPMNRSMPGLPVHHQLPEFTQTHVHRVGDAIQPSHPLSSTSLPAPNPSQHQGLFQRVNSLHEVAKVLEFQLQHQWFHLGTHKTVWKRTKLHSNLIKE